LFRQGVLAMSDAKLFDNPEALANAAALIDIRAATLPGKPTRKERAEAQLGRLRLLQREGYVAVIGTNGMTVFRGADA
jgi:hypothetical protein